MVAEELIILKEFGIGATAFILTFLLLRWTTQKAFAQSDKMMELAESTIHDNTKALEKMFNVLDQHTKLKESIMIEMKDCRRERDQKLDELYKSMR